MSSKILFRKVKPEDYAKIVNLVNNTFNISRPYEWFNHFHRLNPNGESIIYVAENESNDIISFRAIVRSLAQYRGHIIKCGQLTDASTRPDYRGRGLFGKLNQLGMQQFFEEGGDFLFSFPGPKSFPIYINKFGFDEIGKLRQAVIPLTNHNIPVRKIYSPFIAIISKLILPKRASRLNIKPLSLPGAVKYIKQDQNNNAFSLIKDEEWLKWRFSIPGRRYYLFNFNSYSSVIVGDTTRRGMKVATIALICTSYSWNYKRKMIREVAHWAYSEGFDCVYAWLDNMPFSLLTSGAMPNLRHTNFVARMRNDFPYKELSRRMNSYSLSMIDADAY